MSVKARRAVSVVVWDASLLRMAIRGEWCSSTEKVKWFGITSHGRTVTRCNYNLMARLVIDRQCGKDATVVLGKFEAAVPKKINLKL